MVDGFKIRGWWEWFFATLSFFVFLALEGAILYAYFVFIERL